MKLGQNNLKKTIGLIFTLLLSLIVVLTIVIEINRENTAPEESSAIYGGQIENEAYPFAGYLIAYNSNQEANICGLSYLSPTLGVTAAHCFDDKTVAYHGLSLFDFDVSQNSRAQNIVSHPDWDKQNVETDLAILFTDDDFTSQINTFAQISSPSVGCDYEVLGYGKTENEQAKQNIEKLRKSAIFCIEEVNTHTFILEGLTGGVCFGDSGSMIVRKDTNQLVGVVSSIIAPKGSTEPCSSGNRAFGVRLDNNSDFLLAASQFDTLGSNFAKCGETCSEKSCSTGLSCNNLSQCVPASGTCLAQEGQFCSIQANLNCSSGLTCNLNTCEESEEVNRWISILSEDLNINTNLDSLTRRGDQVNTYTTVRNFFIYGTGIIILLMIIVLITPRKKEPHSL